MAGRGFLRWPLAASLAAHAAVLGVVVALDSMAPEPPPKPVELVMTAMPTTMDALSLKAEDATVAPPDTAQPVDTRDDARPVQPAAAPPPPPPDQVAVARPEEVARPKPPEQIAVLNPEDAPPEKPVEEVAEIIPDDLKPVEERVETAAQEPPPPPKPRRPQPPRVVARQPSTVVSDSPAPTPAPSPAPPAQTAMLAPAPPRPAAPRGPSQSYIAALRAQLERHKIYPPMAQRRRIEGTATLSFRIGRSGAVLSHRIVASSGYSILDQEVEDMLRRASPLPALPADAESDSLDVVVPISFFLR